jgi:antitoxin ParD1/3/4
MSRTLILTHEQEAALAAKVAKGDFASVEEAARQILDDALFLQELDESDISWMKPLVDEGLASGEPVSLDEHRAQVRAHLVARGIL